MQGSSHEHSRRHSLRRLVRLVKYACACTFGPPPGARPGVPVQAMGLQAAQLRVDMRGALANMIKQSSPGTESAALVDQDWAALFTSIVTSGQTSDDR